MYNRAALSELCAMYACCQKLAVRWQRAHHISQHSSPSTLACCCGSPQANKPATVRWRFSHTWANYTEGLQDSLPQPWAHTPGPLPKCNVSHYKNTAVALRLWNRPVEMYSHHFLYLYFWPVFHLMAKEVGEGITMHMLGFWLLRPMTIPVHTGGHSSGRRWTYFPQGWILRGLTQGC